MFKRRPRKRRKPRSRLAKRFSPSAGPCHQVGEKAKNTVGPILNGLFGRKSGTIEGYNYSEANKSSGITWDEKEFSVYIENPRAKIPGTKMAYAGLKDPKRIENLIAFLKQYGQGRQDRAGLSALAR